MIYRAFASTPEGEVLNATLRNFFAMNPTAARLAEFSRYVHTLSHYRRNAIVRCLHETPGLDPSEIARRTDMPPQTVARLLCDLDNVRIVDMTRTVVQPSTEPEATFLSLTLA